jgi:transcription elongation factor
VLVASVDTRTMIAEIYSLSKGAMKSVSVDRKAFRETNFQKGDLVFCRKFTTSDGKYVLSEYEITDKIIADSPTMVLI